MMYEVMDVLGGIDPAFKRKPVYEKYQQSLASMKELFISSIDPERFGELPIEKVTEPIRVAVPKEVYQDLKICDLNVAEVGCGAICTMQAVTHPSEDYEYEVMKKICETIEAKGYYYPGRGLWWHWFDNCGCRRIIHWHDICTSVAAGHVVTVLVKFPENTRGLFLNILGVTTTREGDYIESANQLVFLTSEGEITLQKLADTITSAPYLW